MLLRWGRRHHRRRETRGRIQEGEAIDVGTGAVGGFDGSGGDKELGFSKGSGEKVIELGAREEFPSVAVGGCLAQAEGTTLNEGIRIESVRESSARKVSYSNDVCDDLDEAVKPVFVVRDGVADVSIPEDLMVDVDPLWKCFVVGYFMNDALHIGSIHSTVNRIWASPGKVSKIDVQFIGRRTVLFRVEDAHVRSCIVKKKFWHISEVPLVLNEWTSE